jgi:hypothetical protein
LSSRNAPLVVALAAMLVTAAPSRAAETAPAVEWLIEQPTGVLQLRLVHDELRKIDAGVLSVDPNRRVVLWEGIPGAYGCRQKLEAPFESIRAVRDEPDGVIQLEIKGQPRDRWIFAPLPDAAWAAKRSRAVTSGFSQSLREVLVGPDGNPLPVGGSAQFAGPQFRPDLVPGEVTADVRLGVERIRQALGRQPAPSVQLYEALYGRPVEVSIADLLENPSSLEGRAVRVRGIAEALSDGGKLELADAGSTLRAVPQPELASLVRSLSRDWAGREIEVSGVLRRTTSSTTDAPGHEIDFWQYVAPESEPLYEARAATIQDLLERSQEFAGQTVRVRGKFRGNNLQHDLPDPGPRAAWVIKAGRHAIWVIGRKPAGRGFALRPDLLQETTKWLEVVGRLEVVNGVTALRAWQVALSAPASTVALGPRLKTEKPPDVVFTLPLTDRDPVTPATLFLVQFNNYMDEESFEGRVRMRYAGASGPDGELGRMRWSYDDTTRTLIVDPGGPLRPGAGVELLLLPGITDAQEAPLLPAPGLVEDGVARLLRWRVQG